MSTKTQNAGHRAIEWLIEYRRLAFSLVGLLAVVGIAAISSMARQEDPSFPYRAGLVKIFYPGATPLQIEQLITDPFEEELAQISEIDEVASTSRDDLAIVNIELHDYVYDTDAAWERVLRAIDRAALEFPAGVGEVEFDDRQIDMPAAVISITGSDDAILLEQTALRIKKQLISLPGVSRIEIEGAPEKELIVKLDQEAINRLGISRQYIANIISQRNNIIPGGVVSSISKNIRLNTQSDFQTIEELRRTNIQLPSGQIVPLNAIAEVALEPKLPLASQVFQDGKRAVSLGVIAQRGQVDIVEFGRALRAKLDQIRVAALPLQVEESFFQPDYVNDRLNGLRQSLMFSMVIIALVIFLAMGWRNGVLVSLVLPTVTLISLGLYSAGGGVFHQMAVIGIVISLGILIDNAIVVVEYIEASIRRGIVKGVAIRNAIKKLAKPLMASTGTTVAAFIPLLLAKGGVGDFTRAIPIMIVIALFVSYVLSVFVLPLIAFYWLQPKTKSADKSMVVRWTESLADTCAGLVEKQPLRLLIAVFFLVAFSIGLSPTLKQEFFPSTDRAQIVVDMEMPTNTPLAVTERVSAEIESRLLGLDSVEALYRSVGGAGFRFYYNMGGAPNESHIARFTINTKSTADNLRLVNWVRDTLKSEYPDVVLVPRLLGQGPPRLAPIEIRVKNGELDTLFEVSQQVKKLLSETPGVTELRSNLDLGTPEMALSIQDNAALSLGLQPNDVASAVFAESRGLSAGQFRYDTDPVPIRVRSSKGQRTSVNIVRNQYVYSSDQQATPLNQLAAVTAQWTPTAVRHHNFDRTVTVLAQVGEGFAFNQILADFEKRLGAVPLPDSVVIEYGGDAAASSEANSNIATAAPLAIGLLIFFMMFQFNSFRRITIVFVTIPLAAVGVIPGLVLSGQPFGFQSLLGVIALIGIVVNNAIVLIDVIDQALKSGLDIRAAVREGLKQRTAPILLTTATTILGLLPLAVSASTLWPPMAWAIISGLLLSTALTLLAIPALCVLLLGKRQASIPAIKVDQGVVAGLVVMLGSALLMHSDNAVADNAVVDNAVADQREVRKIDLAETLSLVTNNRLVAASRKDAEAARLEEQRLQRRAWAPQITLGGEYARREDDSLIDLPQPIGALITNEDSAYVYELKLTQPLFQPALQRHQTAAAGFQARASEANSVSVEHRSAGQALDQYLAVLSLAETRRADRALLESLRVRRNRIEQEVELGRVLKTDLLQIEVEINQIRQRLVENENQSLVVRDELKRSLSITQDTTLELSPVGDLYQQLPAVAAFIQPQLSCLQRSDCHALEQQLNALRSQQKSVTAGYLPTVNLSLAEQRSEGQLFVAERDQRALLEFSWALFSGGQRRSEKRKIKAEHAALEQRLIDLQQQLQVDISRAVASYLNGRSALALAKTSVSLSQERLRLSRKRYDNGLLNLDQLLDAEAALSSADATLARAKIDLVRAWVQHQVATGEGFERLLNHHQAAEQESSQ